MCNVIFENLVKSNEAALGNLTLFLKITERFQFTVSKVSY